jgi:transcriptional regulator with XRE-family HTH domain
MAKSNTVRAKRVRSRKQRAFGERLRVARVQKGLTQAELAEQVRLTRGHIWWLEHGYSYARVDTLERIASVLGVEPGWLQYGKGDDHQVPVEATAG